MCFNTEVLTQYLNSRIQLLASLLSFPLYLYHFHNHRIAYNDPRNQKNRMAIAPVCSLQSHCKGYKLILYGRLLMHARGLWTVKKPCKRKSRGAKPAADQAIYSAVMCSRGMLSAHSVWNIYGGILLRVILYVVSMDAHCVILCKCESCMHRLLYHR